MQTFLPYSDFARSAKCLDYRRLGKQRIEAFQLLYALKDPWSLDERSWRIENGLMDNKPTKRGWANHPAALMWKGYEIALRIYYNTMICEWYLRGYNNSLRYAYIDGMGTPIAIGTVEAAAHLLTFVTKPHWLGHEQFHASHRSNLLRKDAKHYGQFNWTESADLPYIWPE